MPAAKEIPGFYYDEMRGKYFKIQPNHAATSGSKYTQSSVRREREYRKVRHCRFINLLTPDQAKYYQNYLEVLVTGLYLFTISYGSRVVKTDVEHVDLADVEFSRSLQHLWQGYAVQLF